MFFCKEPTCLMTFSTWGNCRAHVTSTGHFTIPIGKEHKKVAQALLKISNFPKQPTPKLSTPTNREENGMPEGFEPKAPSKPPTKPAGPKMVVPTTEALSLIPTYFDQVSRGRKDEEEGPAEQKDSEKENRPSEVDNLDTAIEHLFFETAKTDDSLLTHGFSLANLENSLKFSEAAYLGKLSASRGSGSSESREVYLNTHEPFCVATVGVQGSGKSHTLAVVLESCLVPLPHPINRQVVRLHRPMTALVLHYDQNVTSVCEATGLIGPVPTLQKLFGRPVCLPQEKMVVLVSPTYYLQRKKFYGDYCTVRPLLFRWANLTADHIKKLMCINEGDNQLYVASMLSLLRSYQRSAVVPEFQGFLNQVQSVCNIKTQAGPLLQRLALLEAFVAESETNDSLRREGADLFSYLGTGVLVVADLTDPLLSSQEANGIFQVLTEQFRTVPLSDGCGKVLALDEAHKFMSGEASDGLSNAIINAARLMRHDGMRVVVSTQSPKALAPELLELVTVAILHRFHSRDWFTYLRSKVPLEEESFDQLVSLTPGSALVFASRHLLEAGTITRLSIRKRITADRGSSRTNIV
jgi:hypothetical protein